MATNSKAAKLFRSVAVEVASHADPIDMEKLYNDTIRRLKKENQEMSGPERAKSRAKLRKMCG